jgi:protein-arginine kinase
MAMYRKLGKKSDQRKALLRSQVTQLIYKGKIKTTEARAKEVRKIAEQLITQEQNAAKRIAESLETKDKFYRSLGILRSARLISGDEAMELLSNDRFGINSGEFKDVDLDTVDRLIVDIQPATLIVGKGEKLSSSERDAVRADLIRERPG